MYELKKKDRLSYVSLRYGKLIAFLLMGVLFVALIIGLVQYISAPSRDFDAPRFTDYQPYLENIGVRNVDQDFSEIDTRIAIIKRYDEDIKKVLITGGMETESYDTLVGWLVQVPENRRSRFITGLQGFLEEFLESQKKAPEEERINEDLNVFMSRLALTYKNIFFDLLKKEKLYESETENRQSRILLFIGVTLNLLILTLLFPIVIKIEENTRLYK